MTGIVMAVNDKVLCRAPHERCRVCGRDRVSLWSLMFVDGPGSVQEL